MSRSARVLWSDESGLVLSAELIIIVTVTVLGLVVGLAQVQSAVVSELRDTAAAVASLDQSFGFTGFRGCWKFNTATSWTAGSTFIDVFDTCLGVGQMTTEIVCGPVMAAPVVPQAPYLAPQECLTCPPEQQPTLLEPCETCPPDGGVAPTPRPEIPQGPVPQNLPQL
jgi:hypothetical protein